MKYSIYAACFLIVTGIFSCTKQTQAPEEEKPLTKTEMLTKGAWKIIARNYQNIRMTEPKDDFSNKPACVKDNLEFYLADKTFTITEGDTRCPGSTQQIILTRTWSLTPDEKTILIHRPSVPDESYDIIELTDSTLILKSENDPGTVRIIKYAH